MEKIIKLIEEIKSYKTNDELELIDQQTMLEFLYSYKEIFLAKLLRSSSLLELQYVQKLQNSSKLLNL